MNRAKALGMKPKALDSQIELPWYYESMLFHFNRLSFSRKYSQMGPLPIDILAIFSYNDRIVNMDDSIFLDLTQALDAAYLAPKKKVEVSDGT